MGLSLWFTKFEFWLSSTIINSRIFSLQTAHLQIHLLSAVVSGDGKLAFD